MLGLEIDRKRLSHRILNQKCMKDVKITLILSSMKYFSSKIGVNYILIKYVALGAILMTLLSSTTRANLHHVFKCKNYVCRFKPFYLVHFS